MIGPKNIDNKSEKALKEIVPPYKRINGRPGESSNRSIVSLYVHFIVFPLKLNRLDAQNVARKQEAVNDR